VVAACLAREGHDVQGVDLSAAKVGLVNDGRSPIVEPGLGELIRSMVEVGRLEATTDHEIAVRRSELAMVCVGTPSLVNGRTDLRQLERCCKSIGRHLRGMSDPPVVVVRSTIPPGTIRDHVTPWLERAARRRVGDGLGLCYHPEFLREGQAIADYEQPARTVIAASDMASGDRLASLYADLDAPLIRTEFATAELLKYVDNAWHALKVGFTNEVGSIAKQLGIDSHLLMAMFCLDARLNLSEAYLSPGFPFGGSCLPKDLRALNHAARGMDLDLPILSAVLPSNQRHLERVLARVTGRAVERIGILGLSFKEGTDDLRESPMVEIIERLLGKGYDVRVFDPLVDPATMTGANRAFALQHLPHIAKLLEPRLEAVLEHAELLLIGHVEPIHAPTIAARARHCWIVDCARPSPGLRELPRYDGICW